MNRRQVNLLSAYRAIDPAMKELGTHRGRPVIWTFTDSGRMRGPRRHVVVLQANGDPGDLPATWEDAFEFDGDLPAAGVRAIVSGWLSWAIRS